MNLEISTHAREATHEQNGPGLQAIAEESGCSFDPMEIVHVVSRCPLSHTQAKERRLKQLL